jgi:hypothetical protein
MVWSGRVALANSRLNHCNEFETQTLHFKQPELKNKFQEK